MGKSEKARLHCMAKPYFRVAKNPGGEPGGELGGEPMGELVQEEKTNVCTGKQDAGNNCKAGSAVTKCSVCTRKKAVFEDEKGCEKKYCADCISKIAGWIPLKRTMGKAPQVCHMCLPARESRAAFVDSKFKLCLMHAFLRFRPTPYIKEVWPMLEKELNVSLKQSANAALDQTSQTVYYYLQSEYHVRPPNRPKKRKEEGKKTFLVVGPSERTS